MTCHTIISKVAHQVAQWRRKSAPPPPPYPPKCVVAHRHTTPPCLAAGGVVRGAAEFAKHESESAGRGSARVSTPGPP